MPRTSRVSFLNLAAEEPFRIFFPLGVLAGISGVSLWPLFFSGIHTSFYPGVMHARLMIEGFMGAFIIGFLGTAAPRLTGTPGLSRWELFTLLGLFALTVGTHIAERYLVADCIFLLLLGFFLARMILRLRKRTDLPPPSFVLVGFGFLNAVIGTVLLIAGTIVGSFQILLFGGNLLNLGFVLYLILGVGAFLLPRFLDLPRKIIEESVVPNEQWKRDAGKALVAGLLLLISFVIEAFTIHTRAAAALRFVTVAGYLFNSLPFHQADARVTLARCVKLALLLLLAGVAFPAFWPLQRVAGVHLVFVGGYSLIAFAVATRVVLGHTGQRELFTTSLPFLISAAVLLIASAILRVAGDFMPMSRGSILSYASYLWMIAAAVWGWRIVRRVRIPDAE